jgi:hypothetical protein
MTSVNALMVVMKHLTLAKIVQQRKDSNCFHCGDFFSNGHKTICKQLL